jgi:hypothetical protein
MHRWMVMTNLETLGTWKLGNATIVASWFDHDAIRVTNSAGGDSIHSVRSWMRMYDALRDAGYTRA